MTSAYDIANRLTGVGGVSYTWDDNGNLTSDGVKTYAYDHANRLTSVTQGTDTTSFIYDGDGNRVQETTGGQITTFALDLNADLTQVLSGGTNTYLYGNDRIGQFSTSNSVYFLGDALASVRQLTDEDGVVTLSKEYEPYGDVMASIGSGSSRFGYTGENQESGLIYLRARYYRSSIGRFLTGDIWQGDNERPISRNKWVYVYDDPLNLKDSSGRFPDWCRSMNQRLMYENCIRQYYSLSAPRDYPTMPDYTNMGGPGCWKGPVSYMAHGFYEGASIGSSIIIGASGAREIVYSFASMESENFTNFQFFLSSMVGINGTVYQGVIWGLNNVDSLADSYRGLFIFGAAVLGTVFPSGPQLSTGLVYFQSPENEVRGLGQYFSIGLNIVSLPVGELLGGASFAVPDQPLNINRYAISNKVDLESLRNDITWGNGSPAQFIPMPSVILRALAVEYAIYYSWIYEEINVKSWQ